MKFHNSKLFTVVFAASILGACGVESESDTTGRAELPAVVAATGISAELTYASSWGQGYCANVSIKNTGKTAISSWSLVIGMNNAKISSLWSAAYTTASDQITVKPADYNKSIAVGQSVSFGYCATGATAANLVSVSSTGGSNGSGGSPATGGSSATGGSKSTTGGTKSTTGGTKSTTGGSKATGGSSATGGKSSTGGTPSTGGNNSGTTVPPLTTYSTGRTTRYWDCCKPSCGWTANADLGGKKATKTCSADGLTQVSADTPSSCDGGSGFQCYAMAPWAVSDTLSYGYAATGNGNPSCGKCYQLDFTGSGDSSAASALKGKSMIVQIVNIGGDVGTTQFDLLIPGGGVGAFNGCSNQWGTSNLGAQYGGFLTSCNYSMSCVTDMCQTVFGNKPDLIAGCKWFTGWFNAANNPGIRYAEVTCPAALLSKSGM